MYTVIKERAAKIKKGPPSLLFMQKLHALNHKELKNLKEYLLVQFGISSLPIGTYFINGEENIFYFTGSVTVLKGHTSVNALGLYIGEYRHQSLRLSMEGAQLFSHLASKNILELSFQAVEAWFKGESIAVCASPGWYLLSHDQHLIGCGQIKESKLINYCPKARRVSSLH